MDFRVLKPIVGTAWFVARTLNPLKLYQASPQTRLLVAGSLLGLGTAGGVASVMTAPGDGAATTNVATANGDDAAAPASRAVTPLRDLDAGASPIGPPPSSLFSDGDRTAPTVSRGQTPSAFSNSLRAPTFDEPPPPSDAAPQEAVPQDVDPQRFAAAPTFRPRVLSPQAGPIQQVNDESPSESPVQIPEESAPQEPRALAPRGAVASMHDEPSGQFARPVVAAAGTFESAGDESRGAPPAVEPTVTPVREIPPSAPQFRDPNGGSNLRAPPELGPAPPARSFGSREFGAPPLANGPAPSPAGLSSAPPAGTLPPAPAFPAAPSLDAARDTGFGASLPRVGFAPEPSAGGASSALAASLPAATLTSAALTSATPGVKQLEGLQAPALAMEKLAPQDVQVGKPALFQTKIRNVGQVVAQQVIVIDQIPAGTRLVEATPQPTQSPDGALLWKIGVLQPGEETLLTMQVIPEREGEIGSVAQMMLQAQASVRAVSTRPQLVVKHTAPAKTLIGETVMLNITLTNTGTGAATGLVLSENVPDVLSHPAGRELEYEIGTLRPGETKQIALALKAAKAGVAKNLVVAGNDTNVSAQDEIQLEVIAPQLEVVLNGPKVRYLERQATYSVQVANPGTAPAVNVELVTFLPRGFKYLSSDKNGQYDTQNHAVFWSLEQLPPGVNGEVQVTVLPVEIGEQKFRVESRANLGLQKVHEQTVQVEGLSELQFSVQDVADPIEVGSDTVYEIKLVNRGQKPATNVQVAIGLPAELQPVSGDGPSRVVVANQQFSIEPLPRMAAGAQALYKIQVRGLRSGDPRIRVQLTTDESPNPVTKEESTRVYEDK